MLLRKPSRLSSALIAGEHDIERMTKNVQGYTEVTLLPLPSNSPRDPLNWPTSKKYISVPVLSFSPFAGFTTALTTKMEVVPPVKLYGVTSHVALQNSGALGGIVVGSVFMYWVSLIIIRLTSLQLSQAVVPFKIAVTPVSLLLNVFTLLNFGFYVAMNSVTPVWLQKPVAAGGYGFTPFQNALFQFFHWGGIDLALPYGQLGSDRLPLWCAARFGRGDWKPEYRLQALWLPALICNPIGIGLFGFGLNSHLSWGFLGFSQILVTFGSLCITPITVNYLSECFTHNIQEAAMVLNVFRIGFGLSIAFYINQWVEDAGFSWCYRTMSFIQIFFSSLL
ncbi:hypothetical protein DPV78_004827 [Talaromyces pinophilus]|nr:hypothetical protein DPV78_004827 [Talaromyces pinophilus]